MRVATKSRLAAAFASIMICACSQSTSGGTARSALEPQVSRCAAIPQQRGTVFAYGEFVSAPVAELEVESESLSGLDFDGSGATVFRVPLVHKLDDLKDIRDLRWELYIVRDRCARSVGSYRGATTPTLADKVTNGFKDFVVQAWSEELQDMGLRTYTYDGRRYIESPLGPK